MIKNNNLLNSLNCNLDILTNYIWTFKLANEMNKFGLQKTLFSFGCFEYVLM